MFPGYEQAELQNSRAPSQRTRSAPPRLHLPADSRSEEQRQAWGDYVTGTRDTDALKAVSRMRSAVVLRHGPRPALESTFEVTPRRGETVTVRPVFDVKQ